MKNLFGILILLSAAIGISCQPKISRSPESPTIDIGTKVIFACDFENSTNQCTWQRAGQDIVETFRYEEINNYGHCELLIQSYSEEDAGAYRCLLPLTDLLESSEEITIQGPTAELPMDNSLKLRIADEQQQFFQEEAPTNTTAEPGRNVTLTCKFPDDASYCFWKKDGKIYVVDDVLKPESSQAISIGSKRLGDCSITLLNVTLEFDGIYVCGRAASGNFPEIVYEPIKVTILDAPDYPQVMYNREIITDGEIRVGMTEYDIKLKCIVKNGNPPAAVQWIANNQMPIPGNITVYDSSSTGLKTVINEINVEKDGYYQHNIITCNATHPSYNTTGNMVSAVNILILEGPVVKTTITFSNSSNTTLTVNYGEKVQLNCTAYAEPDPKFVWQKADSTTGIFVEFGYRTRTINVTEGGLYNCGAKNVYNGLSYVYSNSLTVVVIYTEETGLQAGAIFGIVFGVFVICGLAAWLVYHAYSRQKWCFKGKSTNTRQVPMAEIRRANQEAKPLRSES